MLELEGKKYSREPFDDYAYRARLTLEITEVKNHKVVKTETNIDIYTTNANSQHLYDVLWKRCSDNVTGLKISWWTSREQDERTNKFIKELLKEDNE